MTIRNLYNVYPTQFILAVGARRIAVLNAGNGQHESELILEFPILAPVQVVDINSDGVNDLLIVTKQGLIGYIAKTHQGTTVLTATLTCVIALLALLFMTHHSAEVCSNIFHKKNLTPGLELGL